MGKKSCQGGAGKHDQPTGHPSIHRPSPPYRPLQRHWTSYAFCCAQMLQSTTLYTDVHIIVNPTNTCSTFFTNIMVDSSLDGDRHPCLTIICFYMKHTVVPSINMCAGVWSIVHVNYCHTDLLTMFFTA